MLARGLGATTPTLSRAGEIEHRPRPARIALLGEGTHTFGRVFGEQGRRGDVGLPVEGFAGGPVRGFVH
ncbi:hypothetical protein, partial [Nocardia cyriacigeorgica]|uniref:hypothetical protein n=1 Tax=Nocardia cyriacigeorgica TaxID=135487 RepID=UPI00245897E9